MSRIPGLVCLLVAACATHETSTGSSARAGAPPAERTWPFDGGARGGLPEGFEAASGSWELASDDTAPSGSGTVRQTAQSGSATFNVLLADAQARDVDLSVALRANGGEIDQGGGLVWRARDGENYYIGRWNPLEDNLRLYEVVGGRRQQLASARAALDAGQWHTLRVRMAGTRIECWLDGELLLESSDDTFFQAGRVGLWTKADAQTSFDDLTLRPTP